MSEPRVAIAMPWGPWLPGPAVASFVRLVSTTLLRGQLLDVFMCGHNLLSTAREQLVEDALKAGASHLLFVDSDMVVPPDLVSRLLKHAKPVVSALYYMRQPPYGPVACEQPMAKWTPISHELAGGKGLLKVWCVGFGACLINAHVLRALRGSRGDPMFDFYGREGEDIFFARRCQEAGIGVWLDRDTVCGHVSAIVVDQDTAGRFA